MKPHELRRELLKEELMFNEQFSIFDDQYNKSTTIWNTDQFDGYKFSEFIAKKRTLHELF